MFRRPESFSHNKEDQVEGVPKEEATKEAEEAREENKEIEGEEISEREENKEQFETSEGNTIEFVGEVDIEDVNGEKLGTAKAGLVIDSEKHKGIGIEGASYSGADAQHFTYKTKDGKDLYVPRGSIVKILQDPKYNSLKEKYYKEN